MGCKGVYITRICLHDELSLCQLIVDDEQIIKLKKNPFIIPVLNILSDKLYFVKLAIFMDKACSSDTFRLDIAFVCYGAIKH